MQNFGMKLQEYADSGTRKRRSRLCGLVLSVVVVISVVSSLIMPAISATKDDVVVLANDSKVTFTDMNGKEQSFDIFDPSDASIAKDNAGNDKNYSGTGTGADETRDVSFRVDFYFAQGALKDRFVFCKVDGNVKIPEGGLPANGWGTIKDDSYSNPGADLGEKNVSGHYKIIEIKGEKYIFIEFIPDYAEKNKSSEITGKVEFDATLKRKDNELDNKSDVFFGNKKVEVKGFKPLTMGLEKTGTNNADSKTITWKITVTNPISGVLNEIEDEQFAKASNITVVPAEAGSVNEAGKFVFAEGCKEKEVTITYTTPYPDSSDLVLGYGTNVTNSAKLKYDGDKNATVEGRTWIGDYDSVKKSGKADYNNNTVEWTITVDNRLGADLNGYILRDSAFAKNDTTDIKLVDSNSQNVTFTRDGNKLTLGSTKDSKLTLTYKTPLDKTQVDNKNEVRLQPPGTTNDYDGKYASATVKSTKFAVKKDGSTSDGVNGEIKWSITIDKFDEKVTFKDMPVTDEMFKHIKDGTLKVTADGKTIDVKVDAANGKIILPDVGDATRVNIEYVTKVTDIENNAGISVKKDYENKVDFGGLTDTKTVTYEPTDSDNKWFDNVTQDGEYVKVPWTVELKHTKGNFRNNTITDEMTAADKDGKTLYQTISKDTFKLFYNDKNDYNYKEVPNNWYTLTVEPDEKSYAIKFADIDALDNVCNIRVTYEGKIDVKAVEQGTKISFKNTAHYNNKAIEKDGTFDIKDKGDTPYQKLDAETGSADNSVKDLKSLPTVTIDGVKYYRFDWKIVVNESAKYTDKDTIDLVDTLPDGMILYENADYLKFNGGPEDADRNISYLDTNKSKWYGSYSYADGKVHFKIIANKTYKWEIFYSTIAKVEDVRNAINTKGYIDFNNKLQDINNGYSEISQTQTVKEKNIAKESNAAKDGCEIRYTVEVNPKALDLAIGDTITLTDLIKCGNTATRKYYQGESNNRHLVTDTIYIDGNSAADIQLKNIKITDMSTGNVLTTDEYSYTLAEDAPKSVQYTSTSKLISCSKDQVAFYVTPQSGAEGSSSEITVELPSSAGDGVINHYYVACGYMSGGYFKTISGVNSNYGLNAKQVTIPLDVSNKYIEGADQMCFQVQLDLTNASPDITGTITDFVKTNPVFNKVHREYAKKMELTVPDSKYLKIEYTYSGHPANAEDAKNESFVVDAINNISFDTDLAATTDNDSANNSFELLDQSKGTSSTVEPFEIEKVDGGDYSLKLNASFKLWKYAKIGEGENATYGWLPATKFTLNPVNNRKVVVWGTDDDTSQELAEEFEVKSTEDCALQLEPPIQTGQTQTGYLYKLVETKAQDGYQLDDTPIYFAYRVAPEKLPNNIKTSDYQFVQNGDVFKITNLVDKVTIEADKVWSDGRENHTSDKVEFKLWKSTTKISSGLPTDAVKVDRDSKGDSITNPVELSDGKWSYTWPSLSGCEKVGNTYKQLYYYIEETRTDSTTQKTYTAVYEGNAARKSGTIKVTNMTGLTIIKNWKDENGNALAENEIPQDSIDVDIYQSTVAPNSPTRVNGDNGLPTDCTKVNTVKLEKAKNWKTVIDNLTKDDGAGNTYYYYVLEQSVPKGFGVTYTYANNAQSIGTATITNSIATVDVDKVNVKLKKVWSDGDSGHSGDTLTFNVYRSLDKDDVPSNFNSFTGDVTQNVKFEVNYNKNGKTGTMANDGNISDSYLITSGGDGNFTFGLSNAWITGNFGAIKLVKSNGDVIDEIKCTSKNGNDLTWDKTSKYMSVGYSENVSGSVVTLKLSNISDDITVKAEFQGYSGSKYSLTANQTVSGGGITPKDNDNPYSGADDGNKFLWKTVTVTATDNWSADIELEKTNNRGQTYYYWFEEVKLGETDISKTNYIPYYRYNGTTDSCIDLTKTGQSIQVYNKFVRRTGKLPTTGGRGVAGFVVAGGALSATAAALLIAKRRRKER